MNDEEYVGIHLNKIIPDQNLPEDIFVFLNDHYVKLVSKGDSLSQGKRDQFLRKAQRFLFIREGDRLVFNQWYDEIILERKKALTKKLGDENEEVAHAYVNVKEKFMSFLCEGEKIKDGLVEVKKETRDVLKSLRGKENYKKITGNLLFYDDRLAEHSLNVAFLSIYIGKFLDIGTEKYYEDLFLGALLHDYGKTRLDPEKSKPGHPEYENEVRNHPKFGMHALEVEDELSDEALTLIIEHHEQFDGKGFPNGVTIERLSTSSQILGLVNFYDNCMFEAKGGLEEKQKEVLEKIEVEKEKKFHPNLVENFKLAMAGIFSET